MDDEKELLKYLSWLDQEFIFSTTDDSLDVSIVKEVKMDDNMTPQTNPDNGIPFGSNTNFEFSDKMIPNNTVNEDMLTNMGPSSVPISDPYQYNYNFLPNDSLYTNTIPTQHLSTKTEVNSAEAPYCVDLNNVHPEPNSYMNVPNSHLNVSSESWQLPPSKPLEIKDDIYFSEEKHIPLETDYATQSFPSASQEEVKPTFSESYASISNPNTLYNYNVPQENSIQNTFPSVVENLHNYPPLVENEQNSHPPDVDPVENRNLIEPVVNSYSIAENLQKTYTPIVENKNIENSSVISPSLNTEDKFQELLNIEPEPCTKVEDELQVKEENTLKVEESLEQQSVPKSEESVAVFVKDEIDIKESKESEPESQLTVNGMESVNCEKMCIRNGCVNRAINNPEWEQEYCSNYCAIIHCRNVFTAWVNGNEVQSQ